MFPEILYSLLQLFVTYAIIMCNFLLQFLSSIAQN